MPADHKMLGQHFWMYRWVWTWVFIKSPLFKAKCTQKILQTKTSFERRSTMTEADLTCAFMRIHLPWARNFYAKCYTLFCSTVVDHELLVCSSSMIPEVLESLTVFINHTVPMFLASSHSGSSSVTTSTKTSVRCFRSLFWNTIPQHDDTSDLL